jgi:hypothetical protein
MSRASRLTKLEAAAVWDGDARGLCVHCAPPGAYRRLLEAVRTGRWDDDDPERGRRMWDDDAERCRRCGGFTFLGALLDERRVVAAWAGPGHPWPPRAG